LKFVALLRGINVGKSVQVPMKTLKGLLEKLGLENVVTYLNSGNVLFESERDIPELALMIENELEKTFDQKISTLVKTSLEIIDIEKSIPVEWNSDKMEQTYVAYLFDDIARPEIISELPIKKEYMEIFYANKAIIWNIKRENYNRSQITKIATHKYYSRMTTRNVNTARKLAELCKEK
jgi:uncharacterized protein (DUF1697 family)